MGMVQLGVLLMINRDTYDRLRTSEAYADEFFLNVLTRSHPDLVHLEQDWAGLQYLLTEYQRHTPALQTLALSDLVTGKQYLQPGYDLGYGPVGDLSCQQVQALNSVLHRVSPAGVRDHFDPPRMNQQGVYPQYWEAQHWEILWNAISAIRRFYHRAAIQSRAVLAFRY